MNEIKTICVCGAGTMGSGIAQVAAMAGFTTIQFDLNPEMLEKSRSAITRNLNWYVSKQKLNTEEKEAILARILFTANLTDCVANLFIEAIIENKEAKSALFNQLAAINSPTALLATNTSSISVTAIAATVQHPERVLGMHFFNPAPQMKLVEIIRAEQTQPEAVTLLVNLARQLGKIPVECKDFPGFIVNRVARQYYLEAMKLVENGYADMETIDAVMESAGFKMGPFKLMDLIGMDINYSVSNIVWEALGKPLRLTPSPIQQQKLALGELGRKTGKGFYQYPENEKPAS